MWASSSLHEVSFSCVSPCGMCFVQYPGVGESSYFHGRWLRRDCVPCMGLSSASISSGQEENAGGPPRSVPGNCLSYSACQAIA